MVFFATIKDTHAQAGHLYTVSVLEDSIVVGKDSKVFFNNIRIDNISNRTLRLGVSFNIPQGWKNLQDKDGLLQQGVLYTIPAHGTKSIPLNLIKQNDATADWNTINVKAWLWELQQQDTLRKSIAIRTDVEPKYTIRVPDNYILVEDKDQLIDLPIYIKNTGNIEEKFELWYQNVLLELDNKVELVLSPGQDTNYIYQVKMSSSTWTNLYQEKISLVIGNKYRNKATTYSIVRPKSKYRDNKSPYTTMPMTITGGLMSINDRTSYFGGVTGSLHLGEDQDFYFYYRSKMYGTMYKNFYQPHVYSLEYVNKKLSLRAGRLGSSFNYFIYNGFSGRVGYQVNEKTSVAVTAFTHDPNFIGELNDGVSAEVNYQAGDIAVSHVVIANRDVSTGMNAAVAHNEAVIVNNEKMFFSVKGALSSEQQIVDTTHTPKAILGYAAGYNFTYKYKSWLFRSDVDHNSKHVPGIRKGQRLQVHEVTKYFGKKFAGVYYRSNYTARNYFRDSLFNTDVLTFNNSNYGVVTGFKTIRSLLTLRTGLVNTKNNNPNMNYGLTQYFGSLDYSLTISKSGLFRLNTMNAIGNGAVTTANTAEFSSRYFRFFATYSKMPLSLGFENNGTTEMEYIETMSAGPTVNYYIGKKFMGSVRYTAFKSTNDENIRHGFGGTLNYNNSKAAFNIQVSGFYTLDNNITPGMPMQNVRSAQISLTKRLEMPLPFRRKYHDFSASLYYDENNNGLKEAHEPGIGGAAMLVNENPMVTNEKGEVRCKNVKDGEYNLNFLNTEANGLIPVDGVERTVSVIGSNMVVQIPFKQGKVIKGRVVIAGDSFSRITMTPDNLKVIATDSTGKQYLALTDANGDFKIYAPAGIFTVSLNPEAFEGSVFKPVKVAYDELDLMNKDEVIVNFEIKQKIRKVRFVDANASAN